MSERFDVITPVQKGDKTYWTRIGSAWQKEEGRWSILLDAFPVNGKLMVVPPKAPKDAPKARKAAPEGTPPTTDDIPF